jgi:predicted nucleic acid-binding protein
VIVVDTNLIAHFFVVGDGTTQAEAVRRGDPIWAAPALWRSEFRNILVRMVRQRALRLEEARRIATEAEHGMAGQEYTAVSDDVIDLAVSSGCTAYDCEFVALAIGLRVPLVTSDRQVLRAFPSIAVAPDAFGRRPSLP